MGKPKALRLMAAMGLVLLIGLGPSAPAAAFGLQSPSSTNYRVDQVYFGNGGALNNCSTSYCAKESSGELTVGNPQSTNYQAEAGFNVDREPYVQFIVNSVSRDLGVLTPGTEATTTGTFSVKTYLAGGYVVQTVSDPPKNGARFLNALASPTAPSTTTEQFGINLVANTSPTSFGAAATGYNTANLYKYVKNDTIASSQSSSGETDYTISYLLGINGATPGGQYTMNDVLVATSTF
jgi:hypothetical protein